MMIFSNFWFFRLIYTRVFTLQFSLRAWIPTVVFVAVIAVLLNFSLIIGSQIQWFDYHLKQDYQVLIPGMLEIPRMYWDIGIVGFATGFLLVIVTVGYETYKNIKHLNNIKGEIEQGYYPIQPNKLHLEIASISSASFFLLLRSFLVWYVIFIYTFIFSFQIYEYVPLLASVAIPAGLAALITFRSIVIQTLLSFTPLGSLLGEKKVIEE